jgi:hypothetical protein
MHHPRHRSYSKEREKSEPDTGTERRESKAEESPHPERPIKPKNRGKKGVPNGKITSRKD